jgi:hypothetical protein
MAAKKKPTAGVVDAALRTAAQLEQLGARFALVGGLAVGARGEPRYTRDVDIAVSVEDDLAAESIIHALSKRGYMVETIIEDARARRLATARLRYRSEPEIFIDLLFASSGIERELVESSEAIAYRPGASLPVARVGHLIAMKVLSESDARLQDRIDLRLLANVASAEDWSIAESSVRLIRLRGYHRGRALVRRLKRWRAEGAPISPASDRRRRSRR